MFATKDARQGRTLSARGPTTAELARRQHGRMRGAEGIDGSIGMRTPSGGFHRNPLLHLRCVDAHFRRVLLDEHLAAMVGAELI